MTPDEFDVDRKVCEAATRGPWRIGYMGSRLCLFRDAGGREIIIDAARKGMDGATLRLRDHETCLMFKGDDHIGGHPDVQFIEQSITRWPAALDEIQRLRCQLDEAHESLEGSRAGNAKMVDALVARDTALNIAVTPVRSWFDGDGEVQPMPSDIDIARMAVEELQSDREQVAKLRAALHQILSTTSEPVVKKFAEEALR